MNAHISRRTARLLSLALIVLLCLSGCPWLMDLLCPEPKPITGSVTVSSAGGTLELMPERGRDPLVTVEIPPAAVSAQTKFLVTAYPAEESYLGPVLKLEPAGTHFDRPVTITVSCEALMKESGLKLSQISLYCIGDDLSIYPLQGVVRDSASSTITVQLLHFSGVVAAPGTLSAAQSDGLAGAAGSAYGEPGGATGPSASALGEGIKAAFRSSFSDPMSQGSFDAAYTAAMDWCLQQQGLQPGAGWLANVMGTTARSDMPIAGFNLFAESYAGTDDPEDEHANFTEKQYGPQGDFDTGMIFVNVFWNEERTVSDGQGGTKVATVIVELHVEYSVSPAHLELEGEESVGVATGESREFAARLWMTYLTAGEGNPAEKDLPGRLVSFDLDGTGVTEVMTGEDGRARVSFTPAWTTSEVDGESTTLRARHELTIGDLEDSVEITEAPSIVESTSPFDAQTEVEIDSAITIRFREEMDTATVTVTVSPTITYDTAWTEGSTLLTLTPAADLPYDTEYTVTVGAGAATASGPTLPENYVFSFRTYKVNVLIIPTLDITGYSDSRFTYGSGGSLSDSGDPEFVSGNWYYAGTTLVRDRLYWNRDISDPPDGVIDSVSNHDLNDGSQMMPVGAAAGDQGAIHWSPFKQTSGTPGELPGTYEASWEATGSCAGAWVWNLGTMTSPYYDDSYWDYLTLNPDGSFALRHVRIHLPAGTDRPDWDGTISGTWTSERIIQSLPDGTPYAFDRITFTELESTMPQEHRAFTPGAVRLYDANWTSFRGGYFLWWGYW